MGQEPQKENTHPLPLGFCPLLPFCPKNREVAGAKEGSEASQQGRSLPGPPPLWGPSPHIPEGSPRVGGRQASSDAFWWSEDPLSWLTPWCPPASHSPRGNPSLLFTEPAPH